MTEQLVDQGGFPEAILDAIPAFIFVIDHDVRIIHANSAALHMHGDKPELILRRLCGDVLHCIYAGGAIDVCGTTKFCSDCVTRGAVQSALGGTAVIRQKSKMKIQEHDGIREVHFLVTTSPFEHVKTSYVLLVLEDVTQLVEFGRLIPICSSCKKVRNDKEYWEQLEGYLLKHTDLKFTHGICPECIKKLYPDHM